MEWEKYESDGDNKDNGFWEFDKAIEGFFGTSNLLYVSCEGDEEKDFWELMADLKAEENAFWEIEEDTGNGTFYHGLKKAVLCGVTYVIENIIDPPFGGSVVNIWKRI